MLLCDEYVTPAPVPSFSMHEEKRTDIITENIRKFLIWRKLFYPVNKKSYTGMLFFQNLKATPVCNLLNG